MTVLLVGQEGNPESKPVAIGPAPMHRLLAAPLSPQAMLRAMVTQERTSRAQAGATVEVIGYEDEAVLKLLAMQVAEHTRLNFRTMDKQSQRELYALMHQDPSHPAPVLFIPKAIGGPTTKPDAEWLK